MAEAIGHLDSGPFSIRNGTTLWDLIHGTPWAVIRTATMGLVTIRTAGTTAWEWADSHRTATVHMDGATAGPWVITRTAIIHTVMVIMLGTG